MIEIRRPHVPVTPVAVDAANLGEMFALRCERSRDAPAFYEKVDGRWVETTWRQFYAQAAAAARGLVELGLDVGECVAVLGPTSGRWTIYDMGAQLAGLVSVGVYPKQSPAQIRYLLEHCRARIVFVDGADELERVREAARELDGLIAIVPWDEALAEGADDCVLSPRRFAQAPLPRAETWARLARLRPDDTAILIYTSGTTGPPKGAMITHANILSMLGVQHDLTDLFADDVAFSFLPMAHAAERVLAFYGRINSGYATAYASSFAAVLDEIGEVQPTVFGSVPRIFEKAYARVLAEVETRPGWVRSLFSWSERVGREHVRRTLDGGRVPWPLALGHRVADALVFRRLRAAFGGRVRVCITGAAPLAEEILEFFWAAGLPIYEVYGMTEATVLTHANRPGSVRLGSVGKPVEGLEHRLADDGEVLVRAPWVFKGYLHDEAATRAAVRDGWLYTGDIGTLDEDGYLRITDRKKHIIITAGGKNLAPANVERAIKTHDPLVSHVHVHGDRRPYVSALIAPSPLETLDWGLAAGVLDAEAVRRLKRELMSDPTARSEALEAAMARVVSAPRFRERIRAAVRRGNAELSRVEQVRRFVVLDRDFSQEHGELTPTMKLRRKALEERHAATFDRIYTESDFAVEA